MSKAKELARELKSIIQHEKGDWHDLKASAYELIDAVLSEPEPELKGWIETEYLHSGEVTRTLTNINTGLRFVEDGTGVRLYKNDPSDSLHVYYGYTFDELKQKIKEAS